MPLSMPTKAAIPTAIGLEYHAAAAPPSALSNASQNSRRRLPRAVAGEGHEQGGQRCARQAGADHQADLRRRERHAGEINAEQHPHHAGSQRPQEGGGIEDAAVGEHVA